MFLMSLLRRMGWLIMPEYSWVCGYCDAVTSKIVSIDGYDSYSVCCDDCGSDKRMKRVYQFMLGKVHGAGDTPNRMIGGV